MRAQTQLISTSNLESMCTITDSQKPTIPMARSPYRADIAVIGQAVMGQNLIMRLDECGYKVVAYNRTIAKVHKFLRTEARNTDVIGANSIDDMVSKLRTPRKIVLLIKAGKAVDDFIEKMICILQEGDIIIDAGNSYYKDSARRCTYLHSKGLLFIGMGVCGGDHGARHGPSLTPGGAVQAWPFVRDILQSICARADGEPCCEWLGHGGAGHFVKMVHNGIEYGDMQLLCEAYHVMKEALAMTNQEMACTLEEWGKSDLESYLLGITIDIMLYKDVDGIALVEKIRDSAGQKGTGRWTAVSALEYGVPATTIGEAVSARYLSSLKEERVHASEKLAGPNNSVYSGNKKQFLDDMKKAIYASKIVLYSQGFMLMKTASKEYGWALDYASIAVMWRGGCVIESPFLDKVKKAFRKKPDLSNLFLDDFFKLELQKCQHSWRNVVATCSLLGIPIPAISTALTFYDGYRRAMLPANLIQAQRDYFGGHSYELTDSPGVFIHTDWTGQGGTTKASTYTA